MSPSFDFTFGRPLDDGAGRWIHGSVVGTGDGYRFKAELWRRYSSSTVQCHPVRLEVARPFRADDFAAYIRLISSGVFEIASRVLELDEAQELEPAGASSILQAVSIDPGERHRLPLRADLTSLVEQLDQVRKRELLGLALARVSF